MKTIILTLSTLLLFSCSNNKSATFDHSKPDTSKQLLLYKLPDSTAKVELGFRIIKDTFKFTSIDSTTLAKRWVKDTIYFIPIVDSARGLLFVPYPSQYILIDGGKNVDSIFKKHKLHFPKPDSTKVKEQKK